LRKAIKVRATIKSSKLDILDKIVRCKVKEKDRDLEFRRSINSELIIQSTRLSNRLSIDLVIIRLIVESNFDSNFRNRLDSSISTLEIDLKFNSISTFLKSNQIESSRFSISKIEIESNCQEIENNIILLRFSIFELML